MTEFEKWLKGRAGIGWYTGAEEGWIGALVWAHSQMVGISPCSEPQQICKNIEEELENLYQTKGLE